jgi:hypothetical protein
MMRQLLCHCAIATVLVVKDTFCHCLYPSASGSSWIQTQDFEMVMQLFYHCAIVTVVVVKDTFCHCISPSASGSSWIQTQDFEMMRLCFYHCATIGGHGQLKIGVYMP